jgi:alkylation response protein AidB-like acyl-CoA dehydrogenase
MNFDLSEEQQMIADQVAKFVANESPVERFRRLRETERGWEPEMWARMAEQGWLAIALPEEQGGFGGSFVDVAIILEQLGRGLVPEPFIPSVVLAGGILSELGRDSQREAFLTPMIEGRTSLAFAYAEKPSSRTARPSRRRAARAGGSPARRSGC